MYTDYFYPDVPKVMLYNILKIKDKIPSNTFIFGVKLMKTLGIEIVGINVDKICSFKNINEVIKFKNGMQTRPNNVSIKIIKKVNKIEISGRLSNPKTAGNIRYDLNIGALTSISKTLRILGWDKDIIITKHGVKQEKYNDMRDNKFLKLSEILNIKLEGITENKNINIPEEYWHYEKKSEKVGSIFIHLQSTYNNKVYSIYENHAGCERGYFYDNNSNPLTIPKKRNKKEIPIPDLILKNNTDEILILEAKQSSTLNNGLNEIENYDIIENEYITLYYYNYLIHRWIITYGEDIYNSKLNDKVLFHLNTNGSYYINKNAPQWFIDLFNS